MMQLSLPVTAAVLSLTALLGACASADGPALRASDPVIYLQSEHAPYPVSMCLARKLPHVKVKRDDSNGQAGADLLVRGGEWLVHVTAAADGGSVISARRGADGGDSEPAVRYAIARCAL